MTRHNIMIGLMWFKTTTCYYCKIPSTLGTFKDLNRVIVERVTFSLRITAHLDGS